MQSDMAKQENGRRHGNNFTFQRAASPFPTAKTTDRKEAGECQRRKRALLPFQPRPCCVPTKAYFDAS